MDRFDLVWLEEGFLTETRCRLETRPLATSADLECLQHARRAAEIVALCEAPAMLGEPASVESESLVGGARVRLRVPPHRVDVLVMFDMLELAGKQLVTLPLSERRRELEQLVDGLHPCLQLVSQTADIQQARDWLTLSNVEGVVAKRIDRPYIAGRARDWIKVKRSRTVECAVIGFAGEATTPKLVLALRYTDGQLHHLGRPGGVICHPQRTRRRPL